MHRFFSLAAPLASLVCMCACVCTLPACSDSAQFTTRYAPTFTHVPHAVSILGVYRDGRMNPDTWAQIGPGLSAPFGGKCAVGYDAVAGEKPDLSAAIDDYTRENGIGDELLDQLGPAATGDLIMVVTVAGHVAPKNQELPDTSSITSSSPSSIGPTGKYRGTNNMGSRNPSGAMRKPRSLIDGAEFEMSASLYSIRDRSSVGMVAMQYSGSSVDDAVSKLAAKLGAEIPRSTCAGWNWNAPVDGQRIRELIGH